MSQHTFEKVTPFNRERLYRDGRYSIQNMLLREVHMPSAAYTGELTFDVWSDRELNVFWDTAKKIIETYERGESFFVGASDASFLEWASTVVSHVNNKPIKLTGAAVVRFTDASSGYPVLRLTGIVATEDLQTRPYGITRPERSVMSMDGYNVIVEEF